jgi:hypothetical protein
MHFWIVLQDRKSATGSNRTLSRIRHAASQPLAGFRRERQPNGGLKPFVNKGIASLRDAWTGLVIDEATPADKSLSSNNAGP